MTNKEYIITLLAGTERRGIGAVIRYLCESDFFQARCHRHHFQNGGLAAHSVEVYGLMQEQHPRPADSVVIVSLLHDIGTAKHPGTQDIGGHGRRSVTIIEDYCGFSLMPAERDAILYHMHPDAPQIQGNELAKALCRADQESTVQYMLNH